MSTLIVIAKEPVAGRVKTRLVPPLTYDDAAMLAGAALQDTLENLDGYPAARRVLAFDGDPTSWLPSGWAAVRQPSGGLDRRLAGAFAAAGSGPAVLVGMDTPQARSSQLALFDPYRYDACLGPASDGGYWAVGFADPADAAGALIGIPMSTADTGALQLRRMRRLGLRVQLLDELVDFDDIATAEAVAASIPTSRFALALTGCEVRG